MSNYTDAVEAFNALANGENLHPLDLGRLAEVVTSARREGRAVEVDDLAGLSADERCRVEDLARFAEMVLDRA
jgi:hypothetical protein